MKYNFDKLVDRNNTFSVKWNFNKELLGCEDVIPMWIADMDFETVPEVKEELINRCKHGIYGYSKNTESYYESVIDWMKKRHGFRIEKDWLSESPGVVTAVNTIIRTFTRPGDKVVVQRPVYYPFFKAIENNGCHIVNNPLKVDGIKYSMDFEDLNEKLKDPRVKIMVLCSPHNPVGRVWEKVELKKLGDLCLKHDVLVISDEIHSDLVYKEYKHTPFASICKEFANISITCTAPSKTFNLAGLQVSNIIIPNKKLRDEYNLTLENTGINRLNLFGYIACQTAYRKGEEWLSDLIDYLKQNKEFLKKYIETEIPKIKVIDSEGTYLVWLDCRGLGMSKDELKIFMIEKAGVAFDEGYIFGKEGEGFERINIACQRSILEKALKRMKKAIDNV